MMNYVKFQTECMNRLEKREKVVYCELDHETFVSADGYFGIVIPDSKLYLNRDFMSKNEGLAAFIKLNGKDVEVCDTGMTQNVVKGKKTFKLHVFASDEFKVYVDERYYSWFAGKGLHFKCQNPHSAVKVYAHCSDIDFLVGIIMPVQYKGD